MLKPTIFREYDIRGIAETELLDADVRELGQAIGTYLQRHNGSNINLVQTKGGDTAGGFAVANGTYRGSVSLTAGANITVGGSSAADLAAVGLSATTTTLSGRDPISAPRLRIVSIMRLA